jgi:hypothetical protein
MFPKSFDRMTWRAPAGTQSATPAAVRSASEAEEWNAELARWREAAKTDPQIEAEMCRAFLRAGKEVHAARGTGPATTRETELRRMFPNSFDRMVAKGAGK